MRDCKTDLSKVKKNGSDGAGSTAAAYRLCDEDAYDDQDVSF